MTFEELREMGDKVTEVEHDEARWGYRTFAIYKHSETDEHWGVSVYVTTGDEGGIEAESEPVRVALVEVTTKEWRVVRGDDNA